MTNIAIEATGEFNGHGPTDLATSTPAVLPPLLQNKTRRTSGVPEDKTVNGGAAWTAVNTGLSSMNVPALAIDPVTPATVYAGTIVGGCSRA